QRRIGDSKHEVRVWFYPRARSDGLADLPVVRDYGHRVPDDRLSAGFREKRVSCGLERLFGAAGILGTWFSDWCPDCRWHEPEEEARGPGANDAGHSGRDHGVFCALEDDRA